MEPRPNDGRFRRHRGDGERGPAGAADPPARCRGATVVSRRRATGGMDCVSPDAGGIGRRGRDRVSRMALRPAAHLYARRLCAPARHSAPGRWVLGRHAGDRGTDRTGCRAIREDQFRHAPGNRKVGAAGLLDLAAGRAGGPQPSFPERGLVQSLCRLRASHLRRGSAGFSRRTSGDSGSGVALSLVRAVRLGVLSSGCGLALRGLWHTRYRPPLRAYPSPTRGMVSSRADDRRTPGERPRSFRCICGCRPPTPMRPRPPAPCSRAWW